MGIANPGLPEREGWVDMPRKTKPVASSTRVLDYSESMSLYERESLAAEAQIKAERTKPPKPTKRLAPHRLSKTAQ
jgi:hypothetical protein